ncbi:MAG: hypothetical protein Aurels2KO_51760 [Aureliella sp.]
MRQLVELQEHADEFKAVNTEVIFVFREERDGVAALKKMRDKYKTSFTLTLDYGAKATKPYSPARRTFDNYVLDSDGVVRAIVDGTLRTRAKADALLKTLKSIEAKRKDDG